MQVCMSRTHTYTIDWQSPAVEPSNSGPETREREGAPVQLPKIARKRSGKGASFPEKRASAQGFTKPQQVMTTSCHNLSSPVILSSCHFRHFRDVMSFHLPHSSLRGQGSPRNFMMLSFPMLTTWRKHFLKATWGSKAPRLQRSASDTSQSPWNTPGYNTTCNHWVQWGGWKEQLDQFTKKTFQIFLKSWFLLLPSEGASCVSRTAPNLSLWRWHWWCGRCS